MPCCARSSTDRASDYGSEGWGFESLRAHELKPLVSDFQPRQGFLAFHGELCEPPLIPPSLENLDARADGLRAEQLIHPALRPRAHTNNRARIRCIPVLRRSLVALPEIGRASCRDRD